MKPIKNVKIVNREQLKPNDYNPNVVSKENLKLLKESILVNGWTLPIVCRADYTIIDGFHRYLVAGELAEQLGGKVPVVFALHNDDAKSMYGTITHNRARGVHQLEPMKKIVQRLIASGKTVDEISKELGMKKEEIFRLSDFTKEDFLRLMSSNKYSNAFDLWRA